jgi:hypothetical protein
MLARLFSAVLVCWIALAWASSPRAAQMVLNEFNAVGPTAWLNGGDATTDSEGGAAADTTLGRVLGNGNDWFELAVVADGLDVRGWRLDVCDGASCTVQITFSNAAVWANLRAGTIITIAEDLPENASYDPAGGDWWIAVRAGAAGSGTYVSATPFNVSNSNWQLVIRDASNAVVFGPAGEGIVAGVGVGSTEVFKLEAAPSALTFPSSASYADGVSSSYGAPNRWSGGLGEQDFSALRLNLPIPDRDGDGVADDGDFSGVVGDAPCANDTLLCDDNCAFEQNPAQANAGSSSLGDACECGDANDDGLVTSGDADEVRAFLARLTADVSAPRKCAVAAPASCDIRAAVGIERATTPLPPPIAPVCEAAAGPADPSDLLYEPDRLLEIDITLAPADWDALRFQARDVYDTLGPGCMDGPPVSPYTEFPANLVIDGQPYNNVALRKKGFYGSADQYKPSLKVDTDEYVGGQLIYGLENLTLNNARQDPALVKQCLGYALFAAAGLPSARCNFAHVTVNGQDLGIYVNVEEVETPYLARYFANTTGNVYEGTISDFRPTWENTFEKKTNEENPDRSDLAAISAALALPDDQLLAALEPLVDLDEFYTYWAVEGIIGHWDGYQSNRNNFYVYFDPADGGRLHFLPWGIDALFANGNPFTGNLNSPAPVVFPRGMLARRLYLHPTSRAAFLARVQSLMSTVWNATALNAEINRMEAMLEPVSGPLDAYLNPVRSWINGRAAAVQTEIGGGGPAWTMPLDSAQCLSLVGNVNASFSTTYGSGSGSATMSLTLNGSPVATPIALSAFDGGTSLRVTGVTSGFTTAHSAIVQLHPALYVPGTLPLGGALVPFAQTSLGGQVQVLRLLVNGSITFSQAGSTAGAPVVGTVSGGVAEFVPVP